ncbi:hypothetical protein MAR_011844 [Mya arenaria]|uniref:Uncharacterized protein n=1 Tax=Mya arenaria TaxID=6604 RepID=A0ABY7FV99_MYAAR|nr:hypothetical protein MAR_011844 [Mya arenaria]
MSTNTSFVPSIFTSPMIMALKRHWNTMNLARTMPFQTLTVHGETVDITAAKIIRQGDCRKVAKKERNLVEDINASIFLDVTTSMPGNGKYLSNISWTYTALQEHRIPRKFILYFNFFHVNDIDYDKVCLVLKTKQSLLQKHLDAVCPLDNNQHDHSDDCRNNRLLLHYGDQFILVEENALQPAVDTSLNHSIIIAIVSATAFGSIVITTIVFVVRRCRTKKSSRSRPTIRTPVAVNSDSEMYNQQSSTGTEMQTFLSNNMTTKNDDLCSHSKKLHSNADLDIYRREEIKPLQYDPDIVSENHDYSKHEYDPEEHIKDDMRCRCNITAKRVYGLTVTSEGYCCNKV